MAQFFTQPVDYGDNASDYKGLQELANTAYDTEQKRNLNKLFSSTVDDTGGIDEGAFYKGVKEYGLNPESAREALRYHQAQKAQQVADAQQDFYIRQYGRDPKSAKRVGAPVGDPNAPVEQVKTIATDSPTPQPSQEAPQQPQAAAPQPAPAQQAQTPVEAPKPLTPASFGDYFQTLKSKAAEARNQLGLAPKTTMNEDGTTNTDANATAISGDKMSAFLGMNGLDGQDAQRKDALAKFLGMQTQLPSDVLPNAPVDGSVAVDGSTFAPAAGEWAMDDNMKYGYGNKPTPEMTQEKPKIADTRTIRQMVEDSEDLSKSQLNGGGNAIDISRLMVNENTPPEVKKSIATTLALRKYDNDGSDASINNAMVSYVNDRVKAVGPAPIMAQGLTGTDLNDYYKRLNDWQKNKDAVVYEIGTDLGKEYADQFNRTVSASGNNRAQAEQGNAVAEKRAELAGASALTNNLGKILSKEGGHFALPLNPMTFNSRDDIAKFAERSTAYAKLGNQIPKTAMEQLAWAKNFSQAEGLGEAEGTRNLLMMLGAPDKATRLQIALSNGSDFNWATLVSTGVADELSKLKPANIADLKKHMKFSDDWRTHTGANGTPQLRTGGSEVNPYTQSMSSEIGTQSNPIPYQIGMKAVKGKYYNVPGHGIVEGTD